MELKDFEDYTILNLRMTIIFWILAFLVAITVHEAAHAWMADRLGDPTPRVTGRLSLNPIKHLDPYGTVLLPLFLLIIGSPLLFGWAKPVMFDPYNLKNPRRDAALISLAGPFINLALATLLAASLKLLSPFSPLYFYYDLIRFGVVVNVTLAIFNLIPVHPLDGGKILVGILPRAEARQVDDLMQRYGLIVLFILIFPLFGRVSLISTVISPVISFILNLLLPGSSPV